MSKEKMSFTEWISRIDFDDYKEDSLSDAKSYFKSRISDFGEHLPDEKVDGCMKFNRGAEYSETITYGDITDFIDEAVYELGKEDGYYPFSEFSLKIGEKTVWYYVRDFMNKIYKRYYLFIPYCSLCLYICDNFGFKLNNKRSRTLTLPVFLRTLPKNESVKIFLVCKTKKGQKVYNGNYPYIYHSEISEFSKDRLLKQIASDIYCVIREKFASDYNPYCRANLRYPNTETLDDVYFEEADESDVLECLQVYVHLLFQRTLR